MPERNAVSVALGDGYVLVAAGFKREKGNLACDLILENGSILFADRGVLNTVTGRQAWATAAAQPDGPTAERMAEAMMQYLLPDAEARLQESPARASQTDTLVAIVRELIGQGSVEVFRDASGTAFLTFWVDSHRETHALSQKGSRHYLGKLLYDRIGKTPGSQSLQDTIAMLTGLAAHGDAEHAVYVRVGGIGDTIYVDLCDADWRVVEIDADGWRVINDPPIKFRRTSGMLPLPVPTTGGSISDLRDFINVPPPDDDIEAPEWILVVAWLIAAFRPKGPFPILTLIGQQGRGKSSLQRVLRALVDPNVADIRALPRDGRDLMIAASNAWCGCYDNLSGLTDWQSDALCRLSTGAGYATRTLYSDLDETIMVACRPLILNAIEEIVTRADQLDRSLLVTQPAISKKSRRSEKELWRKFEAARPALLGACLDVVSTAIRNEPTTELDGLPRMADFCLWIAAAEPALPWPEEAFIAAYEQNRTAAHDITLEASPVGEELMLWMQPRTEWEGSMSELLTSLGNANERATKSKTWPDTGQKLSNVLRRLAPMLAAKGVALTFGERNERGRRILRIKRVEPEEE